MKNLPAFPGRLRLLAIAAATICGPAVAGVGTTGSILVAPDGAPIGPGDTDVGNSGIVVGWEADGSLTVDGGSLLKAGALINALNAPWVTGTTLVTGNGSRIELNGDPIANNWLNRLEVAGWGRGSLTVADGASLDTTVNPAACAGNAYCSTYVGNFAGADATLRVTGAGSNVSLLRTMYVGGVSVFAPPMASFTAGTPGGSTTGRVYVDSGATLRTDRAELGLGPGGTSFTGRERSFAETVVSGAGSLWRVTGGSIASDNMYAYVGTAGHGNAWATLTVQDGATMRFEGDGNGYIALNLTTGGGRTDALVTGTGSKIEFAAESGALNVGRALGSATLELRDGGTVSNVFYTSVGRDGSFGTLTIDGPASLYSANGTATAAAAGSAQVAVFDIGRGGGHGVVNVAGGGRLEVTATTAKTNGPQLNVGRDAASAGTLNIAGNGSTVLVSAASVAPGSSGEAFNPFVRIGRDGSGTLDISGGGKLLVEGHALSTVTDTRRTSVFIGGAGDAIIGGKGTATIAGPGSELRVSGSDAYIGIGHGPQAVGNLMLSNQASIGATVLGVGNFGATGVVRVDNASINLDGQYTGSGQFGAALVIGAGAGATGNVNLSNGSMIRISNTTPSGNTGGGMSIGGSASLSGGDGTLTMSASSLTLDMPNNNGGLNVGRSGSGLLRMSNGSTMDLGGNSLFVGRLSGADGTLLATSGSTINAGFVGVGATRSDGMLVNGGTATMVLNGATLNAQDVFIGSNGYLGGSAGAINASGTILNHGIFSPGSSPGMFTINGNYTAGAGSRLILEVESDGHGGFMTDEVRFGDGSMVDLASMAIEFRFLGATDPTTFQDTGMFEIATFMRQSDGSGGWTGLADSLYDGVTFSAISDAYIFTSFTFSAADGATFTVTPVPEPGTWLLMGLGLAALAVRARRRPH